MVHHRHKPIVFGAMKRRVAAFNSPSSAGLYATWRGGNLDDGANCGLPCANGNNGPGTANWNGVPRNADDKNSPQKGISVSLRLWLDH